MERLRRHTGESDDPYAGWDIELARRMGFLFCAIGACLVVVLWPLSPPDRLIGGAGWVIAGALVLGGLASAFAIRSSRIEWTFEMLLGAAYAGLAGIVLLQWLAGADGAPYERLTLIPVFFVSATNPPRAIVAFLGMAACALAAPLAYDGWNSEVAAGAITSLVIWTPLSISVYLMMDRIRARQEAMEEDEARAREEARIDGLTGIANRRAFEEAIESEVVRAHRQNISLTVGMIDIQRFKLINDEWGHLEGDNTLRRVAAAISDALRGEDRCFRWGGDEFAVVLPGTPSDRTEPVCRRLEKAIAADGRRPDGHPVRVRFGIAGLKPGMGPADLVEAADAALVAAKTPV